MIPYSQQYVDPADISSVDQGVAWLHAAYFIESCPDLYDADLALDSAGKAVRFNPKNAEAWSILGLTQYRSELYEEALKTLSRALELGTQEKVITHFSLAMTHWQLGSRLEAGKQYDRAVSRTLETFPDNPEYLRFKREAAALLGVGF